MELIEKRLARQALRGSNAAITSTDSTNSISSANLLKGVENSNKKGEILDRSVSNFDRRSIFKVAIK